VPGEYNPVEYIAQISPTPLLLPARNDALAPAAFAIAAYDAVRADHLGGNARPYLDDGSSRNVRISWAG